jgi:hypothetical protein
MKEPLSTLSAAQKRFVKAYDACGGNVTVACQKADVKSRTTYYRWLENAEFKEAVESVNESFIDLAETQLRMAVSRGDMNAVFFLLKTKGKSRGYVEKTEHDVNVNPFQELMQEVE